MFLTTSVKGDPSQQGSLTEDDHSWKMAFKNPDSGFPYYGHFMAANLETRLIMMRSQPIILRLFCMVVVVVVVAVIVVAIIVVVIIVDVVFVFVVVFDKRKCAAGSGHPSFHHID